MSDSSSKALQPDQRILLRKAADYCAEQERCISEVKLKFKVWKADQETAEKILSFLLEEGYINEERFARAFVRGKFKNLGWGRIKIRFELGKKKIPSALIGKALNEIKEEEYLKCIESLSEKKLKNLGGDNEQNRLKTMRFLASRGFEPSLIGNLMRNL